MLISLKLKELIVLLKTNRDLIHTIQTILQVFPEGVVIRSLDDTSRETVLKFANNIANKVLVHTDSDLNVSESVKVQIVQPQNVREDEKQNESISLENFLKQQEANVQLEDETIFENMIKIKHTYQK